MLLLENNHWQGGLDLLKEKVLKVLENSFFTDLCYRSESNEGQNGYSCKHDGWNEHDDGGKDACAKEDNSA